MATETVRSQLAWFVDVAVELLDERELRLTPMTRIDWDGVNRELCDRILWQLEEFEPEEVAKQFKVELSFVQSLQSLAARSSARP